MKTGLKNFSSLLLIVLLLCSCSSSQHAPIFEGSSSTAGTPVSSYPAPSSSEKQSNPGYPADFSEKSKVYGPNELPPTPSSVPRPKSGSAAIGGTLFSFSTRMLVPGTNFYLARASDDKKVPAVFAGPDASKGDIQGKTDKNGQFVLDNVPPGDYYLAVWSIYTWEIAMDQEKEPRSARLIEVKEGQQLNLGVVFISWP